MPDPINVTHAIAIALAFAFDGADEAEVAIALRVLQTATERLNAHMTQG